MGKRRGIPVFIYALVYMALVGSLLTVSAADFSSWATWRIVTIAPSGLSAAVTNFPVLVRLNGKSSNGGNVNDSLVFVGARNNQGYDIRFTKTGTTDSLPFEIDRYDSANMVAEFWVLMPTVAQTGTTTLKMFYGKSGISGSPSPPNSVFSNANSFKLVYHLKENGTNAQDASPNGNTGNFNGTITQTPGVIGYGETFDGSTGYYGNTAVANLNFEYVWTVSGWFKTTTNNCGGVCYRGDGGWDAGCTGFYFGSGSTNTGTTGTAPCMVGWGRSWISSSQAMGLNAWHYVAWVYNSTGPTRQVYIDGAPATMATGTNANAYNGPAYPDVGSTFNLGMDMSGQTGNAIGATTYFNGAMDEFRIDSTQRSASWINLCYQTQKPTGSIVTLGPSAPFSPTLLSPSNNAGSLPVAGVTLSWSSTSGSSAVSSYSVQISTDGTFASTVAFWSGLTTTSQASPLLTGGTIYYWQANAAGAAGTGNWSSAWSFSTITSYGPPPLAMPVNGAANQPVVLNVTWIGVTGSLSYSLQVSTVAGFGSTVFSQSGISATTQSVALANASTYYWRVNAYNGSASTAWSSVWSFGTIIGSPTLSSPTNGATARPTTLTLTWGTVNSAASYGVLVSTNSSFTGIVFSQTGLTSPSVTISGLSNSQLYYWGANASNAGGTGSWSAAWSFTTVMGTAGVPQLSSPANGNGGQTIPVTLMWQPAFFATSYEVQVGTSGTFAAGSIVFDQNEITGTSVNAGNLRGSMTYFWRVDAWNNAGAGLWSDTWNFGTAGTSTLTNAKAGLRTEFSVNGEALEYSLRERGDVEISFSDLLGRTALAMKRTLPAGHYAMALKDCSLAAGRYIVHFKAAGLDKHALVLIER